MRLLPAILIVLLSASGVMGQERKAVLTPPAGIPMQDAYFSGNQSKREKIIKAELALTDKQSKQWQTQTEAFQTRAREILQNNALDPAQKQELFVRAQQDHETKVKAILTEDQYQKYRQWNAKRQERWRTLKRIEDRQLPGKTSPGKS